MLSLTVNMQMTAVVRVPFEIVKQRAQTNLHLTPFKILKQTLQTQVQFEINLLNVSAMLRELKDYTKDTSIILVVR